MEAKLNKHSGQIVLFLENELEFVMVMDHLKKKFIVRERK